MTASPHTRLPDGFRVRLRGDVLRREGEDGAAVLLGGSPFRAMSLRRPAAALLSGPVLSVSDAASAAAARRLVDANLADPILGPPVEPDQLTVVVPVRDRACQLNRCLKALHGLRVVVVDDASHDSAAVATVAARHGARLLKLPRNLGPAGARNAGIAAVSTEYVALVDSDVAVSSATLLKLAGHFQDPALALAGPLVRGVSRSPRPRWFERYDAAASSLALGERPCSVQPGAAVGWLPGACLVGRMTAIEAAGGFTAELRIGEDVDLVWRLVAAGWVVRYEPGLEALHEVRPTATGWLRRKVAYGTGGAVLAERHGDAVAVARLSPVMAVAAAGLLLRGRASVGVAVLAGLWAAYNVNRALPPFEHRGRVSGLLAARGLGWAVRQESALLLRHWWPATAALSLVSPAVRRAAISALGVDCIVAATVDRPLRRPDLPGLGLAATALGRRLDDLSYGLGLWCGALNHRSWRALAIKFTPMTTHARTRLGSASRTSSPSPR